MQKTGEIKIGTNVAGYNLQNGQNRVSDKPLFNKPKYNNYPNTQTTHGAVRNISHLNII